MTQQRHYRTNCFSCFSGPLDADAMIHGVEIKHLAMHVDSRDCFTELFRDSWDLPIQPVQWSLVASRPRVLHGMHRGP